MKSQLTYTGLLIGFVLFFAINVAGSKPLRGVRLDLTENQLFTLTEGTKKIARNLEEPVNLKLYYASKLANDFPTLKSYGDRVVELLTEYMNMSGGKIRLEIVEPESFSEAEEEAIQDGIAPIPLPSQDKFYLGLVGSSSTDDKETIPFFDPLKEQLLEYEISRLIYRLANTDRAVVGVLTTLPLQGGPPVNPMQGQGQPEWEIVRQMRGLFDVRFLSTSLTKIEDDVDVLMIVHPKDFSEQTLFAIDQHVLNGGHAMVLVDPFAEADQPPNPQDQMAAFAYDRSSNFGGLLAAWGLNLVDAKIAADRKSATGPPILKTPFVAWLNTGEDNHNADEPTISAFDQLLLPYAGILQRVEGVDTQVFPLIETTTDSMQVDKMKVQFRPDPEALLRDFVPEEARLTVAARIAGKAKTAFPGGRPSAAPVDGQAPPVEESVFDVITESKDSINVIVIADADLLQDRFWTQSQMFGQINLGPRKFTDNGDFVINCLDNLSGSEDLISIRGREKSKRPFKIVDEIRTTAEQTYLREAQDLESKLAETEREISDLQRNRADGSSLILTPEQEKSIQKFRDEQIETRRKLRALRHTMNKDIESLGTRLKLAHILGVPIIAVLCLAGFCSMRRKRL